MRLLSYFIQYVTLRITAGIINILPYPVALSFGWLNAGLSYISLRSRVNTARQRIRFVLGDNLPKDEVNRIAWTAWRNIIFSGTEMVRIPSSKKKWTSSVFVEESNFDVLKKHADTGQGALLAAPHMGSWEMTVLALNHHGIPTFGISGKQRNPFVDAYMRKLRAKQGVENIIRGSRTLIEVLPKLKKGQALGIMPDVRVRTEGISIPFLGGEANLGRGMALIAKTANVPVFPCVATRIGWCKHKLQVFDPIWPNNNLDKEEDIRRITEYVTRIIENEIRVNPDQWFWYNKRWVLDPL